jgi:archaellum component FlaC
LAQEASTLAARALQEAHSARDAAFAARDAALAERDSAAEERDAVLEELEGRRSSEAVRPVLASSGVFMASSSPAFPAVPSHAMEVVRVEGSASALMPRLDVDPDDPAVRVVSVLDAPIPGTDLTELFRRESEEMAEEAEELRAELGVLREQLEQSRALQEEAARHVERSRADLEERQRRLGRLGEELEAAREALGSSASEAERVKQEYEVSQRELGETRGQLQEAQGQLSEMEQQLEASKQQLSATSQQLSMMSQQLRALPVSAEDPQERVKAGDACRSLNDGVTGLRKNVQLIKGYVTDVRKLYEALRKADLKALQTLDRVRIEKAIRDVEPDVTFEELEYLVSDCANYAEDMKEQLKHVRSALGGSPEQAG